MFARAPQVLEIGNSNRYPSHRGRCDINIKLRLGMADMENHAYAGKQQHQDKQPSERAAPRPGL